MLFLPSCAQRWWGLMVKDAKMRRELPCPAMCFAIVRVLPPTYLGNRGRPHDCKQGNVQYLLYSCFYHSVVAGFQKPVGGKFMNGQQRALTN